MLNTPPAVQPGAAPASIISRDSSRYLLGISAKLYRRNFALFAQTAWTQLLPEPPIWNWHMDAICDHLTAVTMGMVRFLMVNVPPRMSKTMLCSVLWPAWHWLHEPGEQFLFASADDRLAKDSSILSRRLIEGSWYRSYFPDEFEIYDDENQVGMYRNTEGGYRQTASVQGRVTGMGGTIQVLDDPHDAKKVESDVVRLGTIAWHDNAWRSRVNNPEKAKKVYIGQRTHSEDCFGHVLEGEKKRWCVVTLPMTFDSRDVCVTYPNNGEAPLTDQEPLFRDPRTVDGEMLNPKRFSAKTAAAEKLIMSERAWDAQYQQKPVGTGGLILKRHWWRPWVYPEWRPEAGAERPMPQFTEVIQVYDTAFEEQEENDFSARTTWGLFNHTEQRFDKRTGRVTNDTTRVAAMLLDMMMEKFTFPDLRDEVIQSYADFDPHWILIEKKASGHDLVNELKRKNIPVKAVRLSGSSGRRGGEGDLIARANSASLMLEKGCIFHPPRPWAEKTIDYAGKFPNGPQGSRDIVSTLVIAWMYLRRYHDLQLPDDEPVGEIAPWQWQQKAKRYA